MSDKLIEAPAYPVDLIGPTHGSLFGPSVTPLQAYELVNKTTSQQELELALMKIGTVQGSRDLYPSHLTISRLRGFMEGRCAANALTRTYGIRQQALYLRSVIGIPEN